MDRHGRYPIKVYISIGRRTRMVSTGFHIEEYKFDSIRGEMIGRGYKRPNEKLAMIRQRIEVELEGLTLAQAVEQAKRICDFDGTKSLTFARYWEQKVSAMAIAEHTRESYKSTFSWIRKLIDVDAVIMEEIDVRFVRHILDSMRKSLSPNTVVHYMNCLHVVVSRAMEDDLIIKDPFKGLRIKGEQTRKRNLELSQLIRLRDMKLRGVVEYARDMFMLSFYLIGINLADLFEALPAEGGRLAYRRAKTGKLYDVKVQPEAEAIIAKYSGGDRLVNLSKHYTSVNVAESCINAHLKRLLPDLSWYWARHTWATVAASLDISIDTISLALGHSFGLSVTNIYVHRDIAKADAANRAVLDLLNQSSDFSQ